MDHAVWDVFDAVALAVPDREAIVWRDVRRTYAELRDRSLRLASVLRDAGLGRHTAATDLHPWEAGQDLVGTYLLNGPEYLEVTLGGYAAATSPFNVNHRYVADELRYLLDDSGARAIVFASRFAPVLAEVLPTLAHAPALLLQVDDETGEPLLDGAVRYENALAAAMPLADPQVSPEDLYVLYTGGTTGMPKGTLWRHADIWMGAMGGEFVGDVDLKTIAEAARKQDRRGMSNAPFMHGAAHWLAMRMLLSGGTIVISSTVDRLDAAEAWRLVEAERIQVLLLVGEAMARPFAAELATGDHNPTTLLLIAVGGAATSPETKARLVELVPNVRVLDSAGASETGATLSSVTAKGSDPEPGVFAATDAVAVLDADLTRRLDPGEDEIGWFAVTGHIPLGYLGDEAKTAATFPNAAGVRWSVPGDRARLRSDGRVELLGRDSVTINTGGEKVFAEEVEAALLRHPAVADVTVVGRPNDRWGQEVVAVVSLTDAGVTNASLIEVAAQRLARFKLPKAIIRVDEVVRSPAGKADYRWAKAVATDA